MSLPWVDYYTWGVRLRESVNKRKIQFFIFKSVRVRLRESVHLREFVNTEFDLGGKTGIWKGVRK